VSWVVISVVRWYGVLVVVLLTVRFPSNEISLMGCRRWRQVRLPVTRHAAASRPSDQVRGAVAPMGRLPSDSCYYHALRGMSHVRG